ncbi:PREDICTED: sorting nexin-4-like [Priapulus caudatus]|uniref:Sorting nexin-4-like n=1 Tax=Priapulus caudatus TaxID=37621 RepID=A0ABM1E5P2_PRICU|nr:PREDICTED: sorting nexin-4-like [Priapulus caudatus]
MADSPVDDPTADEINQPESTEKTPVVAECQKPLLDVVEICITEPERRTGNGSTINFRETYMAYLVETRLKDKDEAKKLFDGPCSLWRRYSEFELLRNYLVVKYPHVVVPPLPEKTATFTWQKVPTDKFDPDFVERRRASLETFLLRLASHHELSKDSMLLGFLRQEDAWKESVIATGFQAKADSKLKTISASFRVKKPDQQFEELKTYCGELEANITNLLKIRAKLVDTLYGVHKVHANYGRVFSEWSAIENEMGDGLQSAGHYMDVNMEDMITNTPVNKDTSPGTQVDDDPYIDTHTNYGSLQLLHLHAPVETTAYAERGAEPKCFSGSSRDCGQIEAVTAAEQWSKRTICGPDPRYLYYWLIALRTVCRKHELLQFELERAEEHLGHESGLRSPPFWNGSSRARPLGSAASEASASPRQVFGSAETPEQKEAKLQQVEEEIIAAEEAVDVLRGSKSIRDFTQDALRDIERFKQQKSKDIRDILSSYVELQIKLCKKGIQIWSNAKGSFERI